jgi:hypothetical protein
VHIQHSVQTLVVVRIMRTYLLISISPHSSTANWPNMWLKFDELVLIYMNIGYRIQITKVARKAADDNTMCNNVTHTFNYGSD